MTADARNQIVANRMSVVRVDHVFKEYQLGNQAVPALQDVSMVVAPGRFLAIAGPSGSGKTTLLNLIGCIDTPTSGDIFIGEQLVSRKTPDQLADIRSRTLGFVFQTFNLLPVLTAAENVEYPMLQRPDLNKRERHARVAHYLDVVGLGSKSKHRPNELSGGQRQRVAIARALAGGPSIILADEPTANLDSKTGESILALMKMINETEHTTFIFSTHDFKIMEMADRVVSVADGRLVI